MKPGLVDTHAHLFMEPFGRDREDVIRRAEEAGVIAVVNVGIDLSSSSEAVALGQTRSLLWASVGVHPHNVMGWNDVDAVRALARSPKVVAIGETGLDYHRDLSPRDAQQRAFRQHLDLALDLDLPVIVHSRDAEDDTLRIIEQEGLRSGVMHCFSGSVEHARRALDMGMYISIAGPITYPGAHRLREVAAFVPLDRLLVETDAPYLAPQAFRGKRNEPAFVHLVAQRCAEVKRLDPEMLVAATRKNACTLFQLMDIPGLTSE